MRQVETTMLIEGKRPVSAHVTWLSSKAPFPSGHRPVITDEDTGKTVRASSMELGKTYDVQIYSRKKEWIDAFCITYMYDKNHNSNVIVKHLGHY